jgi:2-oxoglutarate dehydrogenase E1 component
MRFSTDPAYRTHIMADLRRFHGPNAGYVLELFEAYRRDPASVDPSWRSFFGGFRDEVDAGPERRPAPPSGAPAGGSASSADIAAVLGARALAETIRARGHTAAALDPLSPSPDGEPRLRPEAHGLSESALRALPASVVGGPIAERAGDAAEAIASLRTLYSGTTGYEFDHVQDPDERAWLREAIEGGEFHAPLSGGERVDLLRRLSQVEGFERYLHRTFFGQKRFSIEGTDMLVPVLDHLVERARAEGTREVIVGMAHRGRLNVLAHVMRKPYPTLLAGFQGAQAESNPPSDRKDDHFSGDVKYHMGWRAGEGDSAGIRVTLAPNPSHLEFVNPVVVGMTRAAQDDTARPGNPPLDHDAAFGVLIHGDAAFPGQGVVAETLNMSGLPGYTVGGTIHLIANNQIGFTTDPPDARSTRYASDLAKGFEVPIFHVNADDAEACIAVARLAHAYRSRFKKDVLVDLIGYRRWGHNEGDEPAFTQPRMYGVIREHPTARARWAARLADEGVLSAEEGEKLLEEVFSQLDSVKEALEREGATVHEPLPPRDPEPVETAVPADRLRALNEALLAWPEGFALHPRLGKMLERRREALEEGGVDWGHAETLAFAALLGEGVPIRLAGQDSERGTFSHRHQVLSDVNTGEKLTPLARLPGVSVSFELRNSPLSEMAVMGFEYGYSVGDPEVLVLWEAQFGDFVNGAQVILDQFLSSARAKWGQSSGLVLLLPHGYEGQGPEHSSARLERFLQLAAESNLRVVNCTTSAQYFHLLRRQAAHLRSDPRPLVVMSPKSLLRHPMAASSIEDLSEGGFRPLIPDADAAGRADQVTRLLLCSGKVYVDLMAAEAREKAAGVALARVEELYPFPADAVSELIASFPALQEVVWVQEEPRNMGAWSFVQPRLAEMAGGVPVLYTGRPERSSPAEGRMERHVKEQARIVSAAWEGAPAAARRREARRA